MKSYYRICSVLLAGAVACSIDLLSATECSAQNQDVRETRRNAEARSDVRQGIRESRRSLLRSLKRKKSNELEAKTIVGRGGKENEK